MSKIAKVQTGIEPAPIQTRKTRSGKQDFRGGLSDLPKETQKILLDGVENKLDKSLGRAGKFYQWLSDTKGELQVQVINGIFTTTLAPLMIVFNPFAKNKTKEDKEYLALRQPVSAVIALAGGLTMTSFINNAMDSIYNSGSVKSIDLRLAPSKDFMKRAFNKEYNQASKDGKLKEFLAKYDSEVNQSIKDNAFKNGKPTTAYRRACMKLGYMKQVKDKRADFFTSLISEKPQNINLISPNNISVGGANIQDSQILRVSNFETQADLTKYIDENNLHKVKFRDFMKNQYKFEFYNEADGVLNGKYKPYAINSKLSNIKALDFLKEVGLIEDGKVSENDLRKTLATFQQSRNEKILQNEVFSSSSMLKKDGAQKLQDVAGKISSRVTEMTVGETIGREKSISLGQMLHQLQIKHSDGSLQSIMDMNMSDALLKLNEKFKGKLAGYNAKADLKYIAKNIIKNKAARMGTDAGTHKFYVGIISNLFITAVNCTALNWAYPRFVEAFFPNLVKKDKVPKPMSSVDQAKVEGGNK